MEGQCFPESLALLEDIYQQIASLRRENRFLRIGLVICLIIATLPYRPWLHPVTMRAKRFVTEKIEFVRDGKTVLSIDVHPTDNALVISGKNGEPLVGLCEGMWGGIVGVYTKDGYPVALMDAAGNVGMIFLNDKKGNLIWSAP